LIEDIEPHVAELQIDFSENDLLLFYTDGLTEAENENGEFFEEERLVKLLKQHSSMEVNDIVATIYKDVYRFIGERSILDDITLMIIKHNNA